MILKTLANVIQSNNIATIGVDLFIHSMPSDAYGILMLSRMSGDTIDHEIKGLREGGFQVIVRSPIYDDTLIVNISSLLTMRNKILDNLDIKFIQPRSDPIIYPGTDGNNVEYSVNFDAKYAKV